MRLGLITFTILELAALLGWMHNTNPNNEYPVPIIAIVILFVGLFLEHIVALNDFRGAKDLFKLFSPKDLPLVQLFAASTSEAIVWALWLLVATTNPIAAAVVLIVGIFLQHNVEINIFIGASTFKNLFSGRVLGFTLIEALSGVAWLLLINTGRPIIGAVVLAGGLLTEHMGQGKALIRAARKHGKEMLAFSDGIDRLS